MKLFNSIPFILLAISANAFAEGFYVSGEVTHSSNSLNKNHFDNSLVNAGATGLSSNESDQSNQWRLQGGYRFNPNFAVELGYIDLGKTKYKANYTGGTAHGDLKAGGLDVAALAILPVTENLALFGKAGVIGAKVESSLSATAPAAFASKNDTTHEFLPLLGVGASYKVTQNVDLRADFDHVSGIGKSGKTGEMDSNMLSIGATYNF